MIGVSGAVKVIDPPPAWSPGALESNEFIWGFYVQRGDVLLTPEEVPGPLPGTYVGVSGETFNFPLVTYPAGTLYDLFIISFDPVGTTGSVIREGSITFDGRVLYISDGQDPGGPVYGGIEGADWVTISPDLRTLDLHFAAGPHVDQLFLAVQVPEPGSILTLAPFALLLLFFSRRRR